MYGDRDENLLADQALRAEEHRADTDILDLTELRNELRDALQTGKPLQGGPLLGLPPLEDDVWCDIAGASLLTGYGANTINGWLSRAQPKRNPSPRPSCACCTATTGSPTPCARGWPPPRTAAPRSSKTATWRRVSSPGTLVSSQ